MHICFYILHVGESFLKYLFIIGYKDYQEIE